MDTGWKNPTTVSQGGGFFAWNNIDNVRNEDGNLTDCYGEESESSNNIICSNFNFEVPTGNRIDGVEVRVLKKANAIYGIYDSAVSLIKNLVVSSQDKGDRNNAWEEVLTEKKYGGSNDLWGASLSVGDVNNSGFGISFSSQNNYAIAYIDVIQIKIYYSVATTNTNNFFII